MSQTEQAHTNTDLETSKRVDKYCQDVKERARGKFPHISNPQVRCVGYPRRRINKDILHGRNIFLEET
jgi:hypothetical protein